MSATVYYIVYIYLYKGNSRLLRAVLRPRRRSRVLPAREQQQSLMAAESKIQTTVELIGCEDPFDFENTLLTEL